MPPPRKKLNVRLLNYGEKPEEVKNAPYIEQPPDPITWTIPDYEVLEDQPEDLPYELENAAPCLTQLHQFMDRFEDDQTNITDDEIAEQLKAYALGYRKRNRWSTQNKEAMADTYIQILGVLLKDRPSVFTDEFVKDAYVYYWTFNRLEIKIIITAFNVRCCQDSVDSDLAWLGFEKVLLETLRAGVINVEYIRLHQGLPMEHEFKKITYIKYGHFLKNVVEGYIADHGSDKGHRRFNDWAAELLQDWCTWMVRESQVSYDRAMSANAQEPDANSFIPNSQYVKSCGQAFY